MSFDPSFFTGAGAPQPRRSSGSGRASERTTNAGLSSADITETADSERLHQDCVSRSDLLMQQAGMAPRGVPFAAVPAGLRPFATTPAQPAVSAPASRRQYAAMDWPAGEAGFDVAPSESEELLAAITNAIFSLGSPSCSAESNALTTQSCTYPGSDRDLSASAGGLPHPNTTSALLGYLQSPPAVTRPTTTKTARMQLEALASSLTGPMPCAYLQPPAQAGQVHGLSSGGGSGSSFSFSSGSSGRLGVGLALHALQSQATATTAARARRLSWQPQLPSPSSVATQGTAYPAGHALLPPSSSLLSSVVSVAEGLLGEPAAAPRLSPMSPCSPHPLYKTEPCKSWDQAGACRYGDKCQFAHGDEELRLVRRHPKYRTKVCHGFLMTGSCPYGYRCRFIHGGD